uniref:Pectinesterase n=1 Tax=Aegilops tauschii subsp. strangulata TaxID=200361 RepID=A0A453G8F3_AEGTS
MPPPLRLLALLLLLHLPFALSSRHHHKAPAPPPRKAPPPAANYAAPLPVLLACNATRFRPACVATLSAANVTAASSPSDLLAATLSALRARLPPAVSTARSVLASSKNVNLTAAATNCLTALSLSSNRLAPPPSPSALMPASASLLHLYDCWSAYKYVNFSRTIYDAMAYLNDTITVNSNYISMLAALKRYGDDTSHWAPPQTERDGYWPSPAASGGDVDALGVPKGLPADATVCGAGCDYKTVREAVAAAPDNGGKRFVVYVKQGVYKETVSVPWERRARGRLHGAGPDDREHGGAGRAPGGGVPLDGRPHGAGHGGAAGAPGHAVRARHAPVLHPLPRGRHGGLRLRQLGGRAPRQRPRRAAPAAAAGEGRDGRADGAGPHRPGAAHGDRAPGLPRQRQRRVHGVLPAEARRPPRVPGPALEGVLPHGVRRVHDGRDRAARGVDALERRLRAQDALLRGV